MSGGVHSSKSQVSLRCSKCGNRVYIWRKRSKLKKDGHVKHMWCFECRERTAHYEDAHE